MGNEKTNNKNRRGLGKGASVKAGGAFGGRSARKLHHGVMSLIAELGTILPGNSKKSCEWRRVWVVNTCGS